MLPSTNILLGNVTSHCGRNDSALVSQSVPSEMVVGGSYAVMLSFRNTGTRTWLKFPSDGNHRLGSQSPQGNTQWGSTRVELPQDVPPGGTVQIQFNVIPQQTGQLYSFQWQMVEELVEWFGEYSRPVTVTVTLGKTSVSVTDYGAKGDGVTDDSWCHSGRHRRYRTGRHRSDSWGGRTSLAQATSHPSPHRTELLWGLSRRV